MKNAYPKLYEPLKIGRVTLPNRLAMAPMGFIGLTRLDGALDRRCIDYYLERARGGIGLIITGLVKVESEVESWGESMPKVNFPFLGPLNDLCEAAHALGTKVFIQLTAGFGRVGPGGFRNQPLSASAIPYYWDPRVTCRALTTAEVEKIVKAFGQAARLLTMTEVDGIELHGHEGYLFDQFTTALWNKRTDKYGGGLTERLTFPIEVLNEIKKGVGADFPVQYRFALKHYVKKLNSGALPGEQFTEAGQDIPEGIEMARLLEKAGFDALHVDAGCYDSWYWAHPPVYQEHGFMADMARYAKQAVKIPVTTVGRLDSPALAEKIIAEGGADLIALGRGVLADPEWPMKVRSNMVEDIRPCIGCHDGCMGRLSSGKSLSCAVNPACGRENTHSLKPTAQNKKVVIVGGGVAGLESARVARLRGRQVILFEKAPRLGGHLIEASVPDFKKDVKDLLHWYEKQVRDLGVEIRLGTSPSPNAICEERPDFLLLATGSVPVELTIPGIQNTGVIQATDLLLGKANCGAFVLVVGGGLIGCETALWLAKQGKQVILAEMLPELMKSGVTVPHMNRTMLIDLLNFHRVGIMTGYKLIRIQEKEAVLASERSEKSVKVENIVLSIGLKAEDRLYDSLKNEIARTYLVGDCREPRNIMGAIWDAYEVGRGL